MEAAENLARSAVKVVQYEGKSYLASFDKRSVQFSTPKSEMAQLLKEAGVTFKTVTGGFDFTVTSEIEKILRDASVEIEQDGNVFTSLH